MSVAFYRKYRSKNLDQVVGQDHITEVLKLALSQGKISHAYLFTGPRGVGKTSIARILAHEINHLPYDEESTHPDIIEIDAASNNSVEDIRRLREQIQAVPFSAEKRIYIIDEVHMLSKSAFNALLKTLEEPPAHAVFILATTDAHKLPATIISRTQQFVFRFISQTDICNHLKFIAEKEKIKITDEALMIIAERGGGSFRDSISLLDQISSNSNRQITAEVLEQILGLAPKKQIDKLISAINAQDPREIFNLIEEVKLSGTDLKIFADQLTDSIKKSLPTNPSLAKLLLPIARAKNSDFLELDLLVTLLENCSNIQTPPQKSTIKSASTTPQPSIYFQTATEPTPTTEPSPPKPKDKTKEAADEKPTEPTEGIASNLEKSIKLETKEFVWLDLVNKLAENKNKGLSTILASADYEMVDQTLKIYVGKEFNKKRVDKPQSLTAIAKSLDEIGAGSWQIETFPHKKPPQDSTISKVLDIMGGGEEVKIDEQF